METSEQRRRLSGEPWSLEELARARLDLGAVCLPPRMSRTCWRGAIGGSSLYSSVPIQRIERDIKALNLHTTMHPDTNVRLEET